MYAYAYMSIMISVPQYKKILHQLLYTITMYDHIKDTLARNFLRKLS